MRTKNERIKIKYVKLYDEDVVYKVLGTIIHEGDECVILKHYNMKRFKIMKIKDFVVKCLADRSFVITYPYGRKEIVGRMNRVGDVINGSL